MKTLCEVKNISLAFETSLYQDRSLRDWFVRYAWAPWRAITSDTGIHQILDDVSLNIREGDIVGLIGINGAGKTSLCRCISDYYRPQSGTIKTNGQVRAIFDVSMGIYPELSGRENAKVLVNFLYPSLREEHSSILEEALEFSELGDFLDAPFRIYSNGMQSRLCLSLISARPADILILDEVFEGADQFFREKISRRIEKLMRSSGATIFVSHHEEQIRRVCNRVVLISRSKKIFDGNVEEGLATYKRLALRDPEVLSAVPTIHSDQHIPPLPEPLVGS